MTREVARGVTAMVVGSGALLGVFFMEYWPHESPLIADDRPVLFLKFVGSAAFNIALAFCPILFVRRQTGKTKECYRNVVGALVRQEVPVMLPPETLNKRKPFLRIFLELSELLRIDCVAKIAGDHFLA
jgi:hypothetical protein